MKVSTFVSALALASSASAVAVPKELLNRGVQPNSCPDDTHDLCCDFKSAQLLGLNLTGLLALLGSLGLPLGLDLDVKIGTHCLIAIDGQCSDGKTRKCCGHTTQYPGLGTCGY